MTGSLTAESSVVVNRAVTRRDYFYGVTGDPTAEGADELLQRCLLLIRPLIVEAAALVGDDRVAQFKWAIARLTEQRTEDGELRAALAELRTHPSLPDVVAQVGLRRDGDREKREC